MSYGRNGTTRPNVTFNISSNSIAEPVLPDPRCGSRGGSWEERLTTHASTLVSRAEQANVLFGGNGPVIDHHLTDFGL